MFGAKVFVNFSSVHLDVSPTNPLKNGLASRNAFFNVEPARNASTLRLCSVDPNQVNDGGFFSVTPSNNCDVDYLGESTKGNLNVKVEHLEAFGVDGHAALEGPIEEVARTEAREAEDLLKKLDIPVH